MTRWQRTLVRTMIIGEACIVAAWCLALISLAWIVTG